MSLLTEMVRNKERRLSRLITAQSATLIRQQADNAPTPRDLMQALRAETVQIIAEIKRASPSQGDIHGDLDVAQLAGEYASNGAAAISVLTDEDYFRGSIDDLREARTAVDLPILRKDFIISPYQVYEARAAGADGILLIVGALYPSTLKTMLKLTHDLGMTALLEVHTDREMDLALANGAKLIGINNRNLGTLEVSLDTFTELAYRVPGDRVLVSESGIRNRGDVAYVAGAGADAVLVGTSLVSREAPGAGVAELLGVVVRVRRRADDDHRGSRQRLDVGTTGWGLP